MIKKFRGTAVIIIGGFTLLFALLFFLSSLNFESESEETTGTVVEYDEKANPSRRIRSGGRSKSTGGGVSYRPVVEYQLNGETIRFTPSIGTGWKPYEIGEQVTVLYDPNDPQKAEVKKSQFIGHMIMLGLGLFAVFLIVSGVKELR